MANIQGSINQLLTLAGAGAYGLHKTAEADLNTAKKIYDIYKADTSNAEASFLKSADAAKEFMEKHPEAEVKDAMNFVYNPEEDAPVVFETGGGEENRVEVEAKLLKKGIPGLKKLTERYSGSYPAQEQRIQNAYHTAKNKQYESIEAGQKALERMRERGLTKIKQKDDFEALYEDISKRYPGISQEAADEIVRKYTKMDKGE